MKNTFILMLMAAAGVVTSCSTTDDVAMIDDITAESPSTKEDGVAALIVVPGFATNDTAGEEATTRASYYDGTTQKLLFEWNENDKLGIFPMQAKSSQQKFSFSKRVSNVDGATDAVSHAVFTPDDLAFAWVNGGDYRAYYPYSSSSADIEAMKLDYTGQKQTGKPDFTAYKAGRSDDYNKSEIDASAHLSAKTFLQSAVSTPTDDNIQFKMEHLGGLVRFYLVLPESVNANISEIRLVASKPVFHEKVEYNLLEGTLSSYLDEPQQYLTLALENAHVEKTSSDAYGHYLLAYMMAYPIALTTELTSTDKLYIYVNGKDAGGNDVYFRSNSITKKDITKGGLTQFSVKPNATEDPISLQPISVQEWKDGFNANNNNGSGTGDW